MQYLKSKMPDPFIPPQAFMDFCKLCSDFVVTEGESPLPARGKCPKDMYKYIHQAVSSLYVTVLFHYFLKIGIELLTLFQFKL